MKKKALHKEGEKFFFDVNIFDDGYVVTPSEEELEQMPVYSRLDMEKTRREFFEKGKAEGLKESAASREQFIAHLLQKISQDTHKLFASENIREKTFEHESVRLAATLLKKIFPFFHAKFGTEELKNAVSDILKKKEGHAEITIEVHPDDVREIETHIANLKTTEESKNQPVRVVGSDKIAVGNCRISWADGGAIRDSGLLAGEISSIMEQALAGPRLSGHDRNKETTPGATEDSMESNP